MNNKMRFNTLPYKLCHIIKRKRTLKLVDNLENSQWKSTEEINQIQWHKLKKLINYAYNNVPYYKEIFENMQLTPNHINDKEDFLKLPLLTKDDITKNIDKITSLEYKPCDLVEDSTGGSTGQALHFFVDKKESDIREAITIRGNRMHGLEVGEKHAYIWGSSFDTSAQNRLKSRVYNMVTGCGMFLSSYDLSEQKMQQYATKLHNYHPTTIIGYSSPLYHFAKFLEDNKIYTIRPKSVISSSEVLFDYQRELIESVFGCKVFNRYGCREFAMIAQECTYQSGLHINAEHVYVECLNNNGTPTKPGEKGELVITDLDNYGMPFIRYKIGDLGILSNRICKCGRGLPLIETIEGRSFDVIYGINGQALGGTFWTLFFRTYVKGINQFQLIQTSINELSIKIIVNNEFRYEFIDLLTQKIYEYCGKDTKVNFEIVDQIPLTKSGKFRFVISNISHEKKNG